MLRLWRKADPDDQGQTARMLLSLLGASEIETMSFREEAFGELARFRSAAAACDEPDHQKLLRNLTSIPMSPSSSRERIQEHAALGRVLDDDDRFLRRVEVRRVVDAQIARNLFSEVDARCGVGEAAHEKRIDAESIETEESLGAPADFRGEALGEQRRHTDAGELLFLGADEDVALARTRKKPQDVHGAKRRVGAEIGVEAIGVPVSRNWTR